jgi:hypothetical protein
MPVSARASIRDRIGLLHAEAERQGRDPTSVSITVVDARPDPDSVRSLRDEGVERVLFSVPPGGPGETLRTLDSHAEVVAALAA